jgi:hypothetical protein
MYVVNITNKGRQIPRLIGSKTKVVSAKQQKTDLSTTTTFLEKHGTKYEGFAPAINRLELGAAIMATSFALKVCNVLGLDLSKVHFWTDNENTIRYINGARSDFLTKTNRDKIDTIISRTSPAQWNHVEGCRNPADPASRGLQFEALKNSTLWWHGPDFLMQPPEKWPQQKADLRGISNPEDEPNGKPAPIMIMVPAKKNHEKRKKKQHEQLGHLELTKETWEESVKAANQKIDTDPNLVNLKTIRDSSVHWEIIPQLLIIQEAQIKWAKKLWEALKKNRIPREYANLVKQ